MYFSVKFLANMRKKLVLQKNFGTIKLLYNYFLNFFLVVRIKNKYMLSPVSKLVSFVFHYSPGTVNFIIFSTDLERRIF